MTASTLKRKSGGGWLKKAVINVGWVCGILPQASSRRPCPRFLGAFYRLWPEVSILEVTEPEAVKPGTRLWGLGNDGG